ncbi:hypothetical protein [Lentzea flava]|uniref:hypothetical protein n=1 Tax=Lentzea flava TaxID=103732 RepID=UPI00166F8770|nr:hypothetical protein [Lentzea flava]
MKRTAMTCRYRQIDLTIFQLRPFDLTHTIAFEVRADIPRERGRFRASEDHFDAVVGRQQRKDVEEPGR